MIQVERTVREKVKTERTETRNKRPLDMCEKIVESIILKEDSGKAHV